MKSDLERSPFAYRLLVAFNGGPPDWAPTEQVWTHYPNEHVKASWERVEAEARRFIAESTKESAGAD